MRRLQHLQSPARHLNEVILISAAVYGDAREFLMGDISAVPGITGRARAFGQNNHFRSKKGRRHQALFFSGGAHGETRVANARSSLLVCR